MAYRFRQLVRRPLRLEAFAVLTRVIRHACYADQAPSTQPSLWSIHHDLQTALRSDHPEWLYKDRLHLRLPGRDSVITVDLRNTQFIGADLTLPHFHFGYEPDIAIALDAWVPNDGVFLDIGANWGYFPVFLAARPDFAGKIIALEPFPDSFRALQDVIAGSGFAHLITSVEAAAGSQEAQVRMSQEIFSGNNQVVTDGTIPVRQTTIDRLVAERGLQRLDFIKIDVEGAEADVILGGRDSIERFQPAVVFESWLDADIAATRRPFEALDSIAPQAFYVLDIPLPTAEAMRQVPDQQIEVPCFGTLCPTSAAHRDRWPTRINVLAIPAGTDIVDRLRLHEITA